MGPEKRESLTCILFTFMYYVLNFRNGSHLENRFHFNFTWAFEPILIQKGNIYAFPTLLNTGSRGQVWHSAELTTLVPHWGPYHILALAHLSAPNYYDQIQSTLWGPKQITIIMSIIPNQEVYFTGWGDRIDIFLGEKNLGPSPPTRESGTTAYFHWMVPKTLFRRLEPLQSFGIFKTTPYNS